MWTEWCLPGGAADVQVWWNLEDLGAPWYNISLSPTYILRYGLFHYKLYSMFKLDIQGICETCGSKALDAEIIKCETCQFFFHALCDSEEGNSDGIAKKTHLGLYKQASTEANFSWKCDRCLTVSEENQAASLKEIINRRLSPDKHTCWRRGP